MAFPDSAYCRAGWRRAAYIETVPVDPLASIAPVEHTMMEEQQAASGLPDSILERLAASMATAHAPERQDMIAALVLAP